MDSIARDIIKETDRMLSERSTFESHWQQLQDYLRPDGTSFTSQRHAGSKNRVQVLDNTGEENSELLAASMHGMMTSHGSTWFGLRAANSNVNKTDDVRFWLDDTARRMRVVFESPDSKFVTAAQHFYRDYQEYGTAGVYVQDRPGKLPLFRGRPLKELLIAENNDGTVDKVHRAFRMTARQAVQQWGNAAGPKAVKAASDPKHQDKSFEFVHAVAPRSDAEPGTARADRKAVGSIWVNKSELLTVRTSGFDDMPFLVARWETRSGEVYGRSPGMKALPDVKMLQRVMRAQIRGAEKTIDPSLQVADDGVMSPVRTTPSAINMVRADMMMASRDPIRPINFGARPDMGDVFIQDIRTRIGAAFYRDLLNSSRDPRMTATQFVQLVEETLRIFGPIVSRLTTEWLGPLIDRTFGIMLRGGLLLPVPAALSGQRIEVEYVSPIAKAQRLSEARALAQTEEIMAGIIARAPAAGDVLKAAEAYRHVGELFGVPQSIMNDDDELAAINEARQEAAEAEAAKQDIVDLAGAVGQAAPLINQAGAVNA